MKAPAQVNSPHPADDSRAVFLSSFADTLVSATLARTAEKNHNTLFLKVKEYWHKPCSVFLQASQQRQRMTELKHIQAAESQLQRLLAGSDREALADSLRLLALYVATFKEHYGELDPASLCRQLQGEPGPDPATVRLFESSLHEAISMLSMVRGSRSRADGDVLVN